MSLASAMKYHGMTLDRWMDSTGKVHHGARPTAAAMPLASHTFHAGEEATDDTKQPKWWLEEDAMTREREQMRTWCPQFTEFPGNDEQPPMWHGTINTGMTTFSVAIVHRVDHGLPFIVPIGEGTRLRKSTPHRYVNGNLCVASAEDWDPTEHTAAIAVGWAAHWFSCYIDWLFSGCKTWPLESHAQQAA